MLILHLQSTRTETKRKRPADDSSGPTIDAPSGEMSAIVPVPGMVVSEMLQCFEGRILTLYKLEQPFKLKSKAKGFLTTSQNAFRFPAAPIDDRIKAKRCKMSH